MNPMLVVALLCALTAVAGLADQPNAANSLLSNGDFTVDRNGDQWPDEWPRVAGVTWEQEDGTRFLRFRPDKPGQTIQVFRSVPLRPEHKTLELSCRVRYEDIRRGKELWHDARIILHFADASGRQIKPDPAPPIFRGSSNGWVERSVRLTVPEGARALQIMPAMFQVESGTLDINWLFILPVAAEEGAAPGPLPPAGAAPAAPPAPPVTGPPLPELRVTANQLQTPEGKSVWLQGVAVASMEWSPGGENVLRSVGVAIDDWKANAIRLSVREDFWFGRDPRQRDAGEAYRQLVDAVVQTASGRGAYVLIDLHRFGAPTDACVEFWTAAAERYKNNPAVLFELFNEPHGISWEVWRNGGTVEQKPTKEGDPVVTFHSPGMQGLVAAVRQTGARNVVIAGGLDWAYDLTGIAQGFALEEKGGNGIMYASHIYPWKRDWQGKVLIVANRYPIVVSETGCEPKPMPFIPPEQHENPYTWAPDMIGFVQKNHLHWTAWCFHPKASPRLLMDWDYTPTPFWGAFVKAALLGARFEMNRMR